MLNPMHRVPYRLTPGRVEANRVRAQNLWRQYQCAPGCACCPDEATREANARKKQSAHMKRLQQKADRAVKERGKQYLDEHHPGWREE